MRSNESGGHVLVFRVISTFHDRGNNSCGSSRFQHHKDMVVHGWSDQVFEMGKFVVDRLWFLFSQNLLVVALSSQCC